MRPVPQCLPLLFCKQARLVRFRITLFSVDFLKLVSDCPTKEFLSYTSDRTVRCDFSIYANRCVATNKISHRNFNFGEMSNRLDAHYFFQRTEIVDSIRVGKKVPSPITYLILFCLYLQSIYDLYKCVWCNFLVSSIRGGNPWLA